MREIGLWLFNESSNLSEHILMGATRGSSRNSWPFPKWDSSSALTGFAVWRRAAGGPLWVVGPHDGSSVPQCDECLCWQHSVCLGLLEESIPEQYTCYVCRDPPGKTPTHDTPHSPHPQVLWWIHRETAAQDAAPSLPLGLCFCIRFSSRFYMNDLGKDISISSSTWYCRAGRAVHLFPGAEHAPSCAPGHCFWAGYAWLLSGGCPELTFLPWFCHVPRRAVHPATFRADGISDHMWSLYFMMRRLGHRKWNPWAQGQTRQGRTEMQTCCPGAARCCPQRPSSFGLSEEHFCSVCALRFRGRSALHASKGG